MRVFCKDFGVPEGRGVCDMCVCGGGGRGNNWRGFVSTKFRELMNRSGTKYVEVCANSMECERDVCCDSR